jgi:ferredoxin/flavodoxin---NADP+ reductase
MSSERPLRVAVVGSGPAGFYTAAQLLASDLAPDIDMLERLPTPWGLVRHGVAPDHPEIKSVSRVFEKTARQPAFRFFGNVEVGRDVSAGELARLYDAVVYAVGAQTDRRMGIPGEDRAGSWPATAFVAWYNGHPDFEGLDFDLSGERAVVVGNGNVAIDVARVLALTRAELEATDASEAAIEAIASSGIREIVLLGRRGPVQASFTNPELKELGELAEAEVVVAPAELELDPRSADDLAADKAGARRNLDVLTEFSKRPPGLKPKRLTLRFCVSPVAILGAERVEGIEIVRNRLVRDQDDRIRAVATEQREQINCGLVLRSVGYRGVAIAGLPFDEQAGLIPNSQGRVLDGDGVVLPGVYCAGWIKRGPSGVIGTNKKDASETVEALLDDARAGRLGRESGELTSVLEERGVEYVAYAGWDAIDRHERGRGEPLGRPRVKLASWAELLARARHDPG